MEYKGVGETVVSTQTVTHSRLTHNVTFSLFEGAASSRQERVQEWVSVNWEWSVFECRENVLKQETTLIYTAYTPTYCRCHFYRHMLKKKCGWSPPLLKLCPELWVKVCGVSVGNSMIISLLFHSYTSCLI